jgi:hypothetical protein
MIKSKKRGIDGVRNGKGGRGKGGGGRGEVGKGTPIRH